WLGVRGPARRLDRSCVRLQSGRRRRFGGSRGGGRADRNRLRARVRCVAGGRARRAADGPRTRGRDATLRGRSPQYTRAFGSRDGASSLWQLNADRATVNSVQARRTEKPRSRPYATVDGPARSSFSTTF